MRKLSLLGIGLFGLGILLTSASSAFALRIAIPNKQPRQQAIEAEVIIVGKVQEIEKDVVSATAFPGANQQKVGYQVASIKISENILGAKGLTNIRVGWQPTANPGPAIEPAVPIRPIPGGGRFGVALTKDQEACFFLKKHHEADFYVLVQWGQPLDKKVADFEKQVASVKNVVKAFENPIEALKAKEPADRASAAFALLTRYRQNPTTADGKPAKQEEISAEESKLILEIVAGMSMQYDQQIGTNKLQVFYMLGSPGLPKGYVQPKFERPQPGQPPVDFQKVQNDAMNKWIEENKEKYRIMKYVTK